MIKSHVVLSHEDWNKLRPQIIAHKISFEPSGYGRNVIIHFTIDNRETFNKIDELLEKL